MKGLARAAVRSRLAWILVALHACWFFLAVANMSPPSRAEAKFLENFSGSTGALFAGRPYHFHYESHALQILMLADMPSMIAATPVALLTVPLLRLAHLDSYSGSYVAAALMLLVSSCQWLLIGGLVESRLSSFDSARSLLDLVHRYFALIVVSTLLLTLVLAPMINAHRRKIAAHRAATPSH